MHAYLTQDPVKVKQPSTMQMVLGALLGWVEGGLIIGLVEGGLQGFTVAPKPFRIGNEWGCFSKMRSNSGLTLYEYHQHSMLLLIIHTLQTCGRHWILLLKRECEASQASQPIEKATITTTGKPYQDWKFQTLHAKVLMRLHQLMEWPKRQEWQLSYPIMANT